MRAGLTGVRGIALFAPLKWIASKATAWLWRSFAQGIQWRADALLKRGRLAEAVAGYDKALPLLRAQAPADLARCLANRASALHEQGRLAEAGFDEALPLLKEH